MLKSLGPQTNNSFAKHTKTKILKRNVSNFEPGNRANTSTDEGMARMEIGLN
jgi:hypothetical protein